MPTINLIIPHWFEPLRVTLLAGPAEFPTGSQCRGTQTADEWGPDARRCWIGFSEGSNLQLGVTWVMEDPQVMGFNTNSWSNLDDLVLPWLRKHPIDSRCWDCFVTFTYFQQRLIWDLYDGPGCGNSSFSYLGYQIGNQPHILINLNQFVCLRGIWKRNVKKWFTWTSWKE